MTIRLTPFLLALGTFIAIPSAGALEYAIDCPPHEIHCAFLFDLRADVVARATITRDPAGVQAGGDATVNVRFEALGAGAGGKTSAGFLVDLSSTPGATVSGPSVQVANVTVGEPPVDVRHLVRLDPGLAAGQVVFVPLHIAQDKPLASTHVPFTIVQPLGTLGAIGAAVSKPVVLAPLSAFLGGLLVWLRQRMRVKEL